MCMNQSRLRKSAHATGSFVQPLQMVVTGEGGTGKSWLINHVVRDVQHVFQDRKRRVLLMAHQGMAAYNINERTICATLGLGAMKGNTYNSPYKPLASTQSGL